MDGDSICDVLDDDIDGDGLLNDEETNTGNFDSEFDSLTDSANPDTDGDGVCDGPATPDAGICVAGPDAFPDDPAASLDTDGDGMPDELNGESTTGLIEDVDDDNDIIDDVTELMCGTDPKVVNALPDNDGDGICDALDENDDIVDLPFTLTYSTNNLILTLGEEMSILMPNITGVGEVATWEISDELPAGLTFGWSPARDAHLDGSIRGTPSEVIDATEYTIWANNSVHSESHTITITVVEKDTLSGGSDIDSDDEGSFLIDWRFLLSLIHI